MERFEINIIGCGAALPTPKHIGSTQVVNIREKLFMLDCAEGAQVALRKMRLSFANIQAVFLTHMHGDHTFGLLGMLSTLGLLGRQKELHIYGPAPLQEVFLPQIDYFCAESPFKIILHEIDPRQQQVIYEDRSATVTTLPLTHRIGCCGYLLEEKPTLPHIKRDMIDFYGIPVSQIANIKNGADWTLDDGTIVPNHLLTSPAQQPRSYAYCTDTKYKPSLASMIENVTCLYHEATFTNEHKLLAKSTYHSTAEQAAAIAMSAHANRLLLGHFSSRYNDENVLLKEAEAIFPNVALTYEGMKINL